MKNKSIQKILLLMGVSIFLTGCVTVPGEIEKVEKVTDTEIKTQTANPTKEESIDYTLKDNKFLYETDDDTSVVTMYLTVRQGNKEENTNHTWEELNGHSVYYYDELGIERAKTEAILQVGDENGPKEGELGFGVSIPNAIVNIRGQTSSKAAQKSYKIEIKDGKGSFRDQKTINLNKHVFDGTRFKNKLCYDLMEELPEMIALRTQFVHLYVKDETVNGNAKFEDYGLYTQVEQPNKRFLKNHGFDRYGQLYKINFFEFYRYEDVIKLKSNADYDEAAFNELLEIKGDDNHSKLILMLEDVNDYSKPMEEVFTKWFDEENFFSWMAFHILVGNIDTQSRNTLLYSPSNMDKWYFMSWDNDASFSQTENRLAHDEESSGWEYGVSNYWGNILFQRVLKSKSYRTKLDDKIQEYRIIMTKEKLEEMITGYNDVVWKYRNQLPDILNLKLTNEEYLETCQTIPEEISQNYELYKKSLDSPMPFYIGDPEKKNGTFYINWDNSYDFDMEDVTYTFELAKDYTFNDPLIKKGELDYPECKIGDLEPGQYFVRVTAKNKSGFEQTAFDYYSSDAGRVYGVKCFYVLKDGSIVGDSYDE